MLKEKEAVPLRENDTVTSACSHSKPIFSVILYIFVNLPPNQG